MMGQAVSSPGVATTEWPPPLQHKDLPAALPNYNTVVVDFGKVEADDRCVWHVEGGLQLFPLPVGYRATCQAYGCTAQLSVEKSPNCPAPQFVLRTQGPDGQEQVTFAGYTPTAPMAKWALALRRLDVLNGMDAFGFSNLRVQATLRELGRPTGLLDTPPSQFALGAPVGTWVEQAKATAGQGPSLVDSIRRGMATAQQAQHTKRAPSTAPSLGTWLDFMPMGAAMGNGGGASPRSPEAIEASPTVPGGETGARRRKPAAPQQSTPFGEPAMARAASLPYAGSAKGLPPRPASRAGSLMLRQPSQPLPAPEVHAASLTTRPTSRQRRRPSSSAGEGRMGRGWTAFTAFGLETRDLVREEHPWASATDVEKAS